MRLLLDTHLLLWAAADPDRLSPAARDLIADPANEPLFSAASVWEMGIKFALGREDFTYDPRLLRGELLDHGYAEIPVTGQHANAVLTLPRLHRDPFDRILVAQSLVEEITLLTTDPIVARYQGLVRQV
ncbi:MAG TPA: type II toxin-antitoxin system VapC family toxin [Rhodopila sp.]|jgi:PIN domain nuclease of toxin-antitoxin system